MIYILGLYAILAMTFTIGKMLLAYVPPIFLTGLRMTIAGVGILATYRWLYGKIAIKRQDMWLFMVVSLVHIFIPFTTEFIALQYVAPSCAALMFNLTPCFTAVFSYFLFHEVMTMRKAVGFAIAMIGVWYMIPTPQESICFGWENIYYAVLLISVISCSLGWVLVKVLMKRGYGSMHINGFAMLVGGALALIVSHWAEPQAHIPCSFQFLFLLASIILLANVIFYNLYGYFLKIYSATFLSFIGFVTPLITALYDFLLLGISVDTSFYIATVIVAYGIYIFYREELRQGYIS